MVERAKAADQPDHQENDDYQAESASESSSTVAPVAIISTPSAEQ
jgi:hypothetical protein